MKIDTMRSVRALVIACGCAAAPVAAQLTPTSVTRWGQDDWNTVTLNPSPVIPVFSCPWVDTGLAGRGFTVANGWNITYAGAAASAFVQRDLSITMYYAWAVDSPNVLGLDGINRNQGVVGQDAGGAVFQFKYTPQGTDPINIHFIQGYSESLNGGAYTSHLDTPANSATPFYDNYGVSGINTLPGNASWFQDRPNDFENEIEDYHTDVQFQVFIATESIVAGVHNVTMYGGDWWGYQYSTTDLPAPASLAALLLAGGLWRRRRA